MSLLRDRWPLLPLPGQTLLVRGAYSCYFASPYVDAHGEEDVGLKRGRPLWLSQTRYQALQEMWATNEVRDPVRCRASSKGCTRRLFVCADSQGGHPVAHERGPLHPSRLVLRVLQAWTPRVHRACALPAPRPTTPL